MSDVDLDAEDAFAKARAKWANRGFSPSPKARKAREKQIRSTVDGRTLRVTGRTEQFNFKCTPELKKEVVERAKAEGITIAEWIEWALEAAVGCTPEIRKEIVEKAKAEGITIAEWIRRALEAALGMREN